MQVAKKKHRDNGYYYVRDWSFNSFEFQALPVGQRFEIMDMVLAENAHLIMPGERYEYSFIVGEGDKWVFKTKEKFRDIIRKYKIYQEE